MHGTSKFCLCQFFYSLNLQSVSYQQLKARSHGSMSSAPTPKITREGTSFTRRGKFIQGKFIFHFHLMKKAGLLINNFFELLYETQNRTKKTSIILNSIN